MRCRSAIFLLALALLFSSCATKDTDHRILVSVADQSLELYYKERLLGRYPVSTSRFGLGDQPGSRATPLGRLEVAKKIGAGAPVGAVFKSRRETGEVLAPDAPGRDPIVTRIIWLKGLEPQNRHAFAQVHLYSWHTRRTQCGPTGQFRLCTHEVGRCAAGLRRGRCGRHSRHHPRLSAGLDSTTSGRQSPSCQRPDGWSAAAARNTK